MRHLRWEVFDGGEGRTINRFKTRKAAQALAAKLSKVSWRIFVLRHKSAWNKP